MEPEPGWGTQRVTGSGRNLLRALGFTEPLHMLGRSQSVMEGWSGTTLSFPFWSSCVCVCVRESLHD